MKGKEFKKLMCLLLTAALLPFMSACSGSNTDTGTTEESATEAAGDTDAEEADVEDTDTEEAEETSEEATSDDASDDSGFDLAAGITRTDNADDGSSTLESDIFTLTLPDGATWDYEVLSPTDLRIYNISAQEGDFGGTLLTIEAYEPDDNESYDLVPNAVLGEKDGKKIVAVFTSDIEYDFNDEDAKKEYLAVYDVIQTISDDPSTSPLVLK